jgi:pyrroline-5-carboxylate reductase
METMKLGFLGTGEITAAMVTGLCSADAGRHSIAVSPRNLAIATDLANRFTNVSIASSNQDVLDSSETIVIAVRPAVVRSVLSELRFRSEHQVISVVSALSLQSVSQLVVPAVRVTRAVPLPSTARRIGPTAIYPPNPAVAEFFACVGTVFATETEREFDAICAATATIASFYAFMESVAAWLGRNGVPQQKARDYVARMVLGLTIASVDAPERSFQSLASAHATAGGINEQLLKYLVERGASESLSEGLKAVMQRISAAEKNGAS